MTLGTLPIDLKNDQVQIKDKGIRSQDISLPFHPVQIKP